jgi:hypothetical protein
MSSVPACTPERFDHARRLYETTLLSHREIGAECGVAKSTVATWAHRNDWIRPGETEPRRVRRPSDRARQPTAAGSRRGLYLAIAETIEEARRQIAHLRECPTEDAAERERHARTLAASVRALRQGKDLLAQIEAAAPRRAARPKGDTHDTVSG